MLKSRCRFLYSLCETIRILESEGTGKLSIIKSQQKYTSFVNDNKEAASNKCLLPLSLLSHPVIPPFNVKQTNTTVNRNISLKRDQREIIDSFIFDNNGYSIFETFFAMVKDKEEVPYKSFTHDIQRLCDVAKRTGSVFDNDSKLAKSLDNEGTVTKVIYVDSTKRKRRRKMNKHKHKKRLKKNRQKNKS